MTSSLSVILSRKTMPPSDEHDGEKAFGLRRSLGVVSLTAFGIGNTIGAGIFVLTGTTAAHHAGPAVVLSFVLAAVVCLLAGLCYAEFAGLTPVAGSAYSYAYHTLGEGVAWIIGWCLMLEYMFSGALVAIGWSGYFTAALHDLGLELPRAITSAAKIHRSDGHIAWIDWTVDLPAMLVTLACTAMAMLETKVSSTVNAVIVAAKIATILAVICFGAIYVNPDNWRPFIPPNTGVFGEFGWSGVALGASVVFFAYLGFEGVTTLSEEARDPRRSIPASILASLMICSALYVSAGVVITGIANYRQLDVPDPLYFALQVATPGVAWLKVVVIIGAIVGLISVVFFSILGQARIFLAMARDGLLPPAMGRIDKDRHTPVIGTLVAGLIAAATAGLIPLDVLSELISMGTLVPFAVVCAGVLVLRYTHPDVPRMFRTPCVPLIPAAGVVTCVGLMFSLPSDTWLQLAIWLGIGIVVYAAYGYRHSKLRAPAPAVVATRRRESLRDMIRGWRASIRSRLAKSARFK
jgi:APA family basic amino acid/polyamine antiporter